MYKLHKISQRFLCRIPIDSKQGAPGPPTHLCATIHVYPYPGTPTPTPIPMVPHTYYLHALIHLFIYLIVFVFVYLIVFVSLTLLFSLVLSPLALALPPWQGLPLGRGSRSYLSYVYTNVLFYLIIIQQYTCIVCIYMHCILYVYTSSIVHVSNRCMYVHSVVQCVLYCVYAVLCMYSSIHAVLYSMDYLCMVCPQCIVYVYHIHAVHSVLFILQYVCV